MTEFIELLTIFLKCVTFNFGVAEGLLCGPNITLY